EVQDVASQAVAALLAPRRHQTIVDFCAGAGGKTLALASAMRNTGQVYACDNNSARLARLKPRLTRSGLSNVQPFALDSEHDPKLMRLASKADAVLVDAPCTSSNPLAKQADFSSAGLPSTLSAPGNPGCPCARIASLRSSSIKASRESTDSFGCQLTTRKSSEAGSSSASKSRSSAPCARKRS
ncbi:MAG: hypothetical protein EBW73_06625, partial [Betaproteobacteria bacterium]|nr:hypothetical protein [Betaproteobacteria bacterium]